MRRRANWYALMCGANYWAERSPQLDRIEAYAIGYDTEEREHYERVEPRVTFRNILIDTAREHRARQAAAHG